MHSPVAELVTVIIALTAKEKGAPKGRVLRQALFGWALEISGCAECERDAITVPSQTRGGREAPSRWRG